MRTASNMIVLEGRGISRVFGQAGLAVRALQPTDIAIRRDEVLVIMGPSGSGKTTLLSILGLVLTPTEGEVFVDGKSVAHATADELGYQLRPEVLEDETAPAIAREMKARGVDAAALVPA